LRNQKGYGVVSVEGHNRPAHRVAWLLSGRALTPGLTLDHLCRVRECVNPDHLEEVSIGTNVLRGDTLTAANSQKTECPAGHPLDGLKTNGRRYCLTCHRKHCRESRARLRALGEGAGEGVDRG
jgi:hypothetical protein